MSTRLRRHPRSVRPVRCVGPVGPARAARRPARVIALGLLLIGLPVLGACQTEAAMAWRGARHYTSGSAALDRGDASRAVVELEQAARLVPHASEIRNHLGIAYWQSGRPTQARLAFERAVELDCENQAARANLERLSFAMRSRTDDQARAVTRRGGEDDGG